jgi:hypothetical protein
MKIKKERKIYSANRNADDPNLIFNVEVYS